jgi:membrane-associated phospholipid phosphatase
MAPSWKHLVADALFMLLLLIVTHVLTNIAPLVDRWWIDNDSYKLPLGEPEPMGIMAVYMWVVPGLLLSVISMILLRNFKRSLYVVFVWLQANILTIFVTALFRYFLTEPRPYFSTLCNPVRPAGYILDPTLCLNNIKRRDVQSFPSGHASLVWTTYVFMILMLSMMTRTFSRLHPRRTSTMISERPYFWKLNLFFLVPLVIPIWTSATRVISHNHFISDVIAGMFIGILLPFVVFFNVQRDYILGVSSNLNNINNHSVSSNVSTAPV